MHLLRVLVDPSRAEGIDVHVAFAFDGETTGLHVRNAIAAPTSGEGASVTLRGAKSTWASLVCGKESLSALLGSGDLQVEGSTDAIVQALSVFDLPALRS